MANHVLAELDEVSRFLPVVVTPRAAPRLAASRNSGFVQQ